MLCALAGIRQWDISIYENVIPFPFCTIFDHALKIGAVVVRACHGSVDIGVENKYIIPLRIFFANMELPLNGLFRLVFAPQTNPSRYSYIGVRRAIITTNRQMACD